MHNASLLTFFERLEELRKFKQLSQPMMAELLGIHQTTYNRNAGGKNIPNSETLCKLASHFSAEQIYYLLTGIKPDTVQLTKDDEEIEREIMSVVQKLPHEGKKNLLNTFKMFQRGKEG